MAFNSVPEPILVLYKSQMCHYCTSLSAFWDTPPNNKEDSVVAALKKVYPRLRFYTLTTKMKILHPKIS
jgi:hypothetical protein